MNGLETLCPIKEYAVKEHMIAEELAKTHVARIANEATTRHQIIDVLIHEVLGWPRDLVHCEEHTDAGYADYTLMNEGRIPVMIIEAKKEDSPFELPCRRNDNSIDIRRIKLATLMTNSDISSAVKQVVAYCPNVGCELACITNGHVFIIFRWFVRGANFTGADAIVIPSLKSFSERFTRAYNLLSYNAVACTRGLHNELIGLREGHGEVFYPKRVIEHYDDPVQQNTLARFLSPIAETYFADIQPKDKKLMMACYVFARGYNDTITGVQAKITDSITPFFASDGVSEIESTRSGGTLTQRIARSAQEKRGDVLILYGGKGAGKSTFLRRLFYCDPPTEIRMHVLPVIIDYLQAPQEEKRFEDFTWKQMCESLDVDQVLSGNSEDLLKLFEDRYLIALKQQLSGLQKTSSEFSMTRNRLISEWKQDTRYVVERLLQYWRGKQKGPVFAFDNTDQLPPHLQDLCFLNAQNVARALDAVVIISMREERYCRARTVGVLDAYHNNGFHLASPDLAQVVTKRLKFVIQELSQPERMVRLPDVAPVESLACFFRTCLSQFTNPNRGDGNGRDNALKCFLQECSHDNTRLALELFSRFMTSGYTNVEEMAQERGWTVSSHQVVKPMMIPTRHNYDEEKSLIPNLYQVRVPANGSHFTALRLLQLIRNGIHGTSDARGFQSVASVADRLNECYSMREDCEAALDVLLRHGLVEADNRLDRLRVEKSGSKDEFIYADSIRLTAFGTYMMDALSKYFAYLELVSLDTGLLDDQLCNNFAAMARNERHKGTPSERKARLLSRLERVCLFVEYLDKEEVRECDEYGLGESDRLVPSLRLALLEELYRVRRSASRVFGCGENIDAIVNKHFSDKASSTTEPSQQVEYLSETDDNSDLQ